MSRMEIFLVLGQLFLVHALTLLDSLVVYAFTFALLYLACAGAESLFFSSRPILLSRILPVLTLAAAAIHVSPIGDRITVLLYDAVVFIRQVPGEVPNWQLIIAATWVAGFLCQLIRLAAQCYRLCAALPRLPECHDDALFSQACMKVGIQGRARIKFAGPYHPVASWGIVRATVLVPDDFLSQYDHDERYCIYLHELTHYARRDSIRYVLVAVWKAVFWFDPISGRAAAHYQRTLEIDCDTAVVAKYDINVLDYARLITRTAALQNRTLPGLSSGYLEVRQRLGHLFHDAKLMTGGMSRRAAFAVAAGLALIGWYCSTVSPVGISYLPPRYSTEVGTDGVERAFKDTPIVRRGIFATYARSSIQQVDDVIPSTSTSIQQLRYAIMQGEKNGHDYQQPALCRWAEQRGPRHESASAIAKNRICPSG